MIVTISGNVASEVDDAITYLIQGFTQHGKRVAVVMSGEDPLNIDEPGKDSHSHLSAGACDVIVISKPRWARLQRTSGINMQQEPELAEALIPNVDVAFAVGFQKQGEAHLVVDTRYNSRVTLQLNGNRRTRFHLDKEGSIADLIGLLFQESQ